MKKVYNLVYPYEYLILFHAHTQVPKCLSDHEQVHNLRTQDCEVRLCRKLDLKWFKTSRTLILPVNSRA